MPYILACHLQIDADPAYHFDADPDPVTLMRIRSLPFNLMRTNADPQHWITEF
jgi:hypothetical protein